MELVDLFRVGLRWIHALASATWVGGGLFYLLVLGPALQVMGDSEVRRRLSRVVGREFSMVIKAAIPVFLVSGALLTLDRLTRSQLPPSYVAVLALKIALALWMFWLAQRMGGREIEAGGHGGRAGIMVSFPFRVSAQALVVVLGVIVYLLAIVLKVLYENALRGI